MKHGRLTSRVLCAGLLLGLLSGCASISGKLPPPAPPVATGEFRVGAAKVDITPMPGFSMGGYSAAGRISRGVWMRLQARAFCFEDAEGHSLAMVAVDLWAVPAGLGDRVAELVSRHYGVDRLSREQIVVAATHTHNGPGNFSSSYFYNELAAPQSGFDRQLFNFLAYRIAGAVATAWSNRAPAVLRYNEAPVYGLSRNRSLNAFLANGPDASALIEANRGAPIRATSFPIGGEDAYRAVDPTLRVLKAEKAGEAGAVVAALAFYAVHPTVMDTTTEVYNSDIFGVAASQVERAMGAASPGGSAPIVAVFNGPEGDVSANWRRRDRTEAIALGNLLADGIRRGLVSPGEVVSGGITGRFGTARLADLASPLSGASTLCGAEADWAFFRDAGFHEGMIQPDPAQQIKGQGVKRHPAEDDLHSKAARDLMRFGIKHVLNPPRGVPLAVYRIGSVVIGTLPGEFTTMLGRRIAAAIHNEVPDAQHLLLVGLANEYLSYFTTENEYATQTYEASSMMYGPHAGARIRDELAALAKSLPQAEVRKNARSYTYAAGPNAHFGVTEFDLLSHRDRLTVTYNSLANVLMDPGQGIPVPDYPRFVWIDKNPTWPDDPGQPAIIAPSVAIEVNQGGTWLPLRIAGVPENDLGIDFVTTVVTSFQGKSRWQSTWLAPAELEKDEALRSAAFRFRVRGNGGVFHSPGFSLSAIRESWGLTGVARKPDGTGP